MLWTPTSERNAAAAALDRVAEREWYKRARVDHLGGKPLERLPWHGNFHGLLASTGAGYGLTTDEQKH